MKQPPPAWLLLFLALVAVTAFTGARFEPGDWYRSLEKPPWTPPGWLFAPVWTLLYIGIAVAGWLTWRMDGGRLSPAVAIWGLQLVLNAAWSWLFFGLHRPGAALADILALLAVIVAFIATTGSRPGRALFLPYAVWVAYASALNFEIVRLNP